MADRQQIPEGELAGLLDAVAHLSPVPMLITDGQGRFLAANRPWRDLGLAAAEASGSEHWTDCLDPSSRHRLVQALDQCAHNGTAASLDLELQGRAGRRWSRWWMHRRMIEATPVVVLVALDVHEDVVQRDDLRQLATRDDLTGLVNRRVFLETVEQALRRMERFGEPTGLLYIDLDSFKAVNDEAGHVVGDRVLAAVAARLRQAVRGADVVGRIGGDEFAVLLERLSSPGEAAVVAGRIQEALSSSVEVSGQQWAISASIGIAITEVPGESAMGLLSRADQEMYAVKRARTKSPGAKGDVITGDGSRTPTHTAPSAPVAPSQSNHTRPTITAADLRLLRDGMDTIRHSLEVLLEDLEEHHEN